MTESNAALYEGLFLMNASAGGDLAGSVGLVREMLERAGAEILSVHKWDDRKLAYAIRGQKRGSYIFGLFRVGGVQIANIERDCTLSEQVARVLITRADHLGETEIDSIVKEGEKTAVEVKLREQPEAAATESAEAPEAAETPAAEAPQAEEATA